MECHLKWNITQNGMSLKMECHFEMDCHSEWNITQDELSLKMDCHSI